MRPPRGFPDQEFQIGIPKNQAYNITMYLMAVLLVVGFFANLALFG